MTKHRVSSRIQALQAGYKKNPARENKQEPEIESLSELDTPKRLSDNEASCFNALLGTMPPGVYTKAEIPLLELTARLMSESQLDWEGFSSAKVGHLYRCLSLLGLSPGDRTKLVDPAKYKKNKFA